MDASTFQNWIDNYYKQRGWADLDIFVRIGFLSEETGEVARAIRALEIGRDRPDEIKSSIAKDRENLAEELGDVLGNVAMIANTYQLNMEDIFSQHKQKLTERYRDEESDTYGD